ncbi:MAG: anaerobic ribonucleoside triphosphate reductase [Christensenellaceae bacterium]|nr:anaerobic ribonucleoside triphosphate reductase [Christensenellaceae bacterium]
MSILKIRKRDGREVPFDQDKIEHAIFSAFQGSGSAKGHETAQALTEKVVQELEDDEYISATPTVEQVQDVVERVLIEKGFVRSAKAYILYRAERSRVREMNTRLMRTFEDIVFKDAIDSDIKRENANINGDTAMGSMLKFGSEGAKQFYEKYVMDPRFADAHREGDIHIHDMDFYTLTTTCCQIELSTLFKDGFSTGHGYLREPQDITSYAALACIAIQANQNDQHGGQSIVDFDYGMAPGVKKTFIKRYRMNVARALELLINDADSDAHAKDAVAAVIAAGKVPSLEEQPENRAAMREELLKITNDETQTDRILDFAQRRSAEETDKATFQAMEALVHNLNTMNSRAGAQVPFSSINYGTDTSPEGRLVMKNLLHATEDGLGGGETPIFPIQIFRVKDGISYNPGDPNYDLYRLAIRTSAKRLFPNFSFLDAPFNLQYYKPGHPETEIAYMGCRTRVMGNVYDPSREIAPRRGNLSFTSINLPRIAIKANGDIQWFFEELERKMQLVTEQLDERFAIISRKKVMNFPFLMGQGVWIDSENLDWNDTIGEVLKHGTLTIGFIGLAEALKALRGAHHGESEESQNLGLEIISTMRAFTDKLARERKLNYSLIATPAEGLSGRFVRLDRERFGSIPGVTDREYYTNSFHVPVYYSCSAFHKLSIEAPYHALTNGGHISYVEMDGDPLKNLDAFEKVVRFMHDQGIGYGSINHPVDRDPICGYNGIIDDECPCCHRAENGRPFERIRRITGYLVGTLDRFNNGKRAEERDRVKHGID